MKDDARPRLFYMKYTCMNDYSYKVISLQSNDNITTQTTVYVESVTGIIEKWEGRSKIPGLTQEVKQIENMNCLCKFHLSANSQFKIGGPGTQFPVKYAEDHAKILITSTNEKTENFTVLPGVMKNLEIQHVTTGNTQKFYILQYQSNNLVTEMNFVLPISGEYLLLF